MSCDSTTVLGGIAIGCDEWMTSHDLNDVIQAVIRKVEDRDIRVVLWILASLSFGAVRRMGYVYVAARDCARHADPDLARAIAQDNAVIRELVRAAGDMSEVGSDAEEELVAAVALKEMEITEDWCRHIHGAYDAALTMLGSDAAREVTERHKGISEHLRGRGKRREDG